MSQKMTQSTTLSEDSLSDEGNVDRWGNPSSPGAFAESPIPEEASFLSSEGFQGDRIQGESYFIVAVVVGGGGGLHSTDLTRFRYGTATC